MKVLLFFLFLLSFLYFTTFREGLEVGASIGEYDYLKPHEPTVLDSTTEKEFVDIYNNTTSFSPIYSLNTLFNLTNIKKYATLDEIKYYIKNKKWPYGSYIINTLTSQLDNIKKFSSTTHITNADDAQKVWPTRILYDGFFKNVESQQSPVPLSNDIFTGKAQPPTSSLPSTISPTTSTSSLSPDNYTKLKSICSSI
jgi:hypothetical protein